MKKPAERSITEVRIVEAAVQLFSRRGFKGTSTRDIAHLAGVNEATLFRYFGRKTDLFRIAVETRLQRVKLGRELQSALSSDADPELVVPMVVDFLVHELSEESELMRLLYVAGFEFPGVLRMFKDHLGPVFDAFSGYFGRCSGRGAICEVDPAFATLGLAGAVSAHHRLHRLLAGPDAVANGNGYAAGYAQFWLNALRRPVAAENAAATQSSAMQA